LGGCFIKVVKMMRIVEIAVSGNLTGWPRERATRWIAAVVPSQGRARFAAGIEENCNHGIRIESCAVGSVADCCHYRLGVVVDYQRW
jgi:hypothetical protein